ncbi:hypothetical protein JOC37_002241 [Desulfohalotomaculum tongense]|nr:hypothetical protein [Desulforadius tongensis]MBM7855821.1 hypothetical protein [Desulforadius tongensis]
MAKSKKQTTKFQLDDPKVKKYIIVGLVVLVVISFAIGIGSVSN